MNGLSGGRAGHLTLRFRLERAAVRAFWHSVAMFVVGALFAGLAAAEPLPRSVLIFDQSDTNSTWGLSFRSTLRVTLSEGSKTPLDIYSEVLELGRFNSPEYVEALRTFLRDKYRNRPIGVIVVHGTAALEIFMRLRDSLWPSVSVVFAFAEPETVARLALPPEFTGTTFRLNFRNVVRSARALVPNLKRLVLVGTRYEKDPFRQGFAAELASMAGELEFTDLLDMPLSEVAKRVGELPADAVVYYSSLYPTGSNSTLILTDVVPFLAQRSNRPIVTDNETHIGRGSTGGLVAVPEPMAMETGMRALRLLDGEPASRMPIFAGDFTSFIVDWRQLQRWGINENSLPAGTELRYRPPSLWEQYRWQLITVAIALLLQATVINWLVFERYRRRRAEVESRGRLLEVIHLNRTAATGALSASIAHELNQPLGAIMSNAEAAEILLDAHPPNLDLVKEILGDIRQADERAAQIIQHLRTLLKRRSELDTRVFDLNSAIAGAVQILSSEAKKRGVTLIADNDTHALPVRAEPIHLEQVIVNLAINSMDAMAHTDAKARRIVVRTVLTDESKVEVSVRDSGPGIPRDKLREVFDTFFTTKQEGTGLGLSIARTIVETYGGKIWAENHSDGGAVVRFSLPLAEAAPFGETSGATIQIGKTDRPTSQEGARSLL